MTRKLRVGAFLMVIIPMLLLLGGCRTGAAPGVSTSDPAHQTGENGGTGGTGEVGGPSPAGQPASGPAQPSAGGTTGPAPSSAAAGCLNAQDAQSPPYGSLRPNKWVRSGLCEALVPTDAFYLSFTLPGPMPEATVRQAFRIESKTQPSPISVNGQYINVTFPAGPDDDVILIRLAGPLGENGAPVDLGFRLRRHPRAYITAELQDENGDWGSIPAGKTVPRRPLTLRFLPNGEMNRELLERGVRESFRPGKADPGPIPLQLDWDSEGRLVLKLPEPPPLVQLSVGLLPGEDGLESQPFFTSFFTGEPPELVALDPATGAERTLGIAPVDIWQAPLAPNGKWALPLALRGDSGYAMDLWLLNVATGDLRPTGRNKFSADQFFWLGDRVVSGWWQSAAIIDLVTLKAEEQSSKAERWSALSPDGRFLAGFTQDYTREDPTTFLAPTTLIVHDLVSGREQAYPDAVLSGIRHSEAPPSMTMSWSNDSTTLFVQESRPASGSKTGRTAHWLALDGGTGRIAEAANPPKLPEPSPATSVRVGPNGWSYEQTQPWGPISLHGPAGESRDGGRGLALAWQPTGSLLVIRWPNAEHRRYPGI